MKNKLFILARIALILAVNTCSDTAGGGASYTINGRVAATDDGNPQGALVRLKSTAAPCFRLKSQVHLTKIAYNLVL
jgi:hypothetical protein